MKKTFLGTALSLCLAVSAQGGPIYIDLSSGYGLTAYAGMYSNEKTGFCSGVNGIYFFANAGLEYNVSEIDNSLEAFAGISPLFLAGFLAKKSNLPFGFLFAPNAFQTQAGYGGSGFVLKLRSDLNLSGLFCMSPPTLFPRKYDRRGLNRLTVFAGYEHYPWSAHKDNWQAGLGLLF